MPAVSFTYTRLFQDQVRLVRLRKLPSFDDAIKVDLITAQWPPSVPYEALSYVWGDASNQSTILVSADGAPEKPCNVTQNLSAALRHLYHNDRDRVLWIDALCIDQSNVEEKEEQVRNMDRIYQGAYNVCVWLGPGSSASMRAMDIVPSLLGTIEEPVQSPHLQREWGLFAQLLQREWFSRRWVVQEIALAKKATVHCGYHAVSWFDFSDAISLFASKKTVDISGKPEPPDAHGLGAMTLSFLSNNALRKDRRGNILERRWSVEDLLALLPMFRAQVPHDAVFAILSVASDSADFTDVDYSQSPAELFTSVFKQIARKSRSLDMMFRPWAPEPAGDDARLPSFVAPASRHSYIRVASGRYERRNADSLVGPPRRPIYAATPARGRSPLATLASPTPDCSNPQPFVNKACSTIPVRGVVCAGISELGDVCEDGIVPRSWLETWHEHQLRGEMADVWRVIVAGRSHDGNAAPNWYRRAYATSFVYGPETEARTVDLPKTIASNPLSNLSDYLGRVSACVWGRRFLVSTREREGYYGLVPRGAAPGDMICLFEGCSVPVVFRGRPLTELVLRGLQSAIVESGDDLVAAAEAKIISSLQRIVAESVSGWVGDSLETLTPSFPGYPSKSNSPVDPYDYGLDDHGPFSDHLVDYTGVGKHSEDEWVDKFRQLFESSFQQSLERALTESVAAALSLLSEPAGDRIRGLALESFFRDVIQEAIRHPANAVLPSAPSTEDPTWADVPVRQLFQPLFVKACERAFEQTWRHEAERVLKPPDLGVEAGVYHARVLKSRDKGFERALAAAWAAAWEAAWATSKPDAAKLWSGELDVQVWGKPLQDALENWTMQWIDKPGPYGGEVVGECYVQGLMDGEWWSVDDTRQKPSRIFMIG